MRRAPLLAALALVALAAAYLTLSRGDPAARARDFAAGLARETGRPATIAGPVRFDGWWRQRLAIARVEIVGLGALEDVVVGADGTGVARAAMWGRAGSLEFDDARAVFTDGETRIEFVRAARRIEGRAIAAGLPVAFSGRAAMGGVADLRVSAVGLTAAGGLDPAGGLSLAGDAWRLDGRLTADGALEGRLTGVDPVLGAFEASLRLDAEAIDLADARFATGRAALNRQGGRWALDLRLAEIDLAKAADLLARGAGALTGDLDLRARAGALVWPLGRAEGAILVAGREGDAWAIDELAVRDLGGASLRVAGGLLDLRAADAQRLFAALGVPIDRYMGAVAVQGRFDPVAARISPVSIVLADQRFAGTLAWRDGRLHADLGGGAIDLDPFFVRSPQRPAQRGPLLTRSQQAQAVRAAQPPAPGPGGWSRTPLGFDLLGAVPLDLDLKAMSLRVAGTVFENAELAAAFGRDGIVLHRLVGRLLDGRAQIAGVWRGPPAPGFVADFALDGVPLRRLLPAFGLAPVFDGSANARGRLESTGATASILAGNLRGDVALAAPGAALRGLDLAAVARRYAQGATPPDLVELGRLVARGGDTRLDRVDLGVRVDLGRARVTEFRADGAGARIDGTGTFDIGNWTLDLAADFSFAGRPAFALGAAGPIGGPRLSLRPAAAGAVPPAGSAAPRRPGAPPASR
ncbi:MAG: AsmA family protein [Azospirillum sp.]|nr:AsmA family protein [Azospirillum sp.]